MLYIRPYRRNDSKKIANWCQDKITFYKWSEGRLGDFLFRLSELNKLFPEE